MTNPIEAKDGRVVRTVKVGAGEPTITVSANQPFSATGSHEHASTIMVEVKDARLNLQDVEALNAERKPFTQKVARNTPFGESAAVPQTFKPENDSGLKTLHVKAEKIPATLEALGLPKDLKVDYIEIKHDSQTRTSKIEIVMADGVAAPSAHMEKVLGALKDLKVAGKNVFSEAAHAALAAHVSTTTVGAVAEAASRVGKTALRAIGPIAAVQDVIGYTANAGEAEKKLTAMLGKDGVPKLSKEAIGEYGEIVAKLRLEQGVTLGVSEAFGFSNFMDWGKKHNLPVEALEKLNPTSKTKAQIEEALALRGGQMAQADAPAVVLAQAPDVRARDEGRGNSVA